MTFFWNLTLSDCTASARGNIHKHPLHTKRKQKKQSTLHAAARLITVLWLRLLSVHTFFFLSSPRVDVWYAQHCHSAVRYFASVASLSVCQLDWIWNGGKYVREWWKEMKEDSLPAASALRHSWQKQGWRIRNKNLSFCYAQIITLRFNDFNAVDKINAEFLVLCFFLNLILADSLDVGTISIWQQQTAAIMI